jgi:hypothetical protein
MSVRTRVLSSALFGAAVALAGCGQTATDASATKITGGQPVPESQSDARRLSTVALTTDVVMHEGQPSPISANHSFCSGTIVGPRVIMTAAHCIQKFDETTHVKLDEHILPHDTDYLIYFGTNVSPTGTWVRAVTAIPHPDWDPAQTLSGQPTAAPNDIGVIILEADIPAGAQVAQIGSPSSTLPSSIQLAGFGVTTSRDNNDTGVLRQVDVPNNGADANIKRIQVGSFGRGACAGDSGGPAYAMENGHLVVVGATSTGAELAGRCLGLLNFYTDARYYRDWITSTTAQYL